jgi:hypothetical protein
MGRHRVVLSRVDARQTINQGVAAVLDLTSESSETRPSIVIRPEAVAGLRDYSARSSSILSFLPSALIPICPSPNL